MNEGKFPGMSKQRNDMKEALLQRRSVSRRTQSGLHGWALCLVTASATSMLDIAPTYASVSADVATLTLPIQPRLGHDFVDSLERQWTWRAVGGSNALWQQAGSGKPRKPIGCCSPP